MAGEFAVSKATNERRSAVVVCRAARDPAVRRNSSIGESCNLERGHAATALERISTADLSLSGPLNSDDRAAMVASIVVNKSTTAVL
jgi:hypothetical protein